MSISVELLWSNDPLPINEIIENPTVVVNLPIGGTIITSNVTQSYVDDQDALLQDQINTKLDASEYNQHFKGVYVDLAALQIAIPTANDGDYAHIDLGVGSDREVAIWDNDDAIWVASTGSVASTTDEVAEGSTNRYFTEPRVRQTVLTGLDTSTATPALATDQLLAAIGKLQAQINNIAPPTWVNVTTLAGYTASSVDQANSKIEVSKQNGMIWIRGYFVLSGNVSQGSPIVRYTQTSYLVDSTYVTGAANISPLSMSAVMLMTPSSGGLGTISYLKFNPSRVAGNSTNFNLSPYPTSLVAQGYFIVPTCLGKALNP